jgi:hypothetical protein
MAVGKPPSAAAPVVEAKMSSRAKLFLLMGIATTVVPYLMSTGTGVTNLAARIWPPTAGGVATPETNASTDSRGSAGKVSSDGLLLKTAPQAGRQVVHPLEDVLRFDVTTAWVLANWPRVSAGLAELDLQGYRVPLVSGTSDGDVAGSLTYYFNPKQRVARITFFGTTGDARKLVALLESRYGFKRTVVPEPNLFVYQVKSWGKVTSEMRIRPAPVVRSEVPNSRFEVALLVDRPKSMD